MTDQTLNELALQAWKDAMGDALTAVKLLRDRTDLGLREAGKYIERTAHQVGGRFNLRLVTSKALALGPHRSDEFAAALAQEKAALAQEERENDTRLAAHRAARGVRKVRGAK